MKKRKKQYLTLGLCIFLFAGCISLLVLLVKFQFHRIPEKEGILMEKKDALLLFGYLCCKEDEIATKSIPTEEIMAYIQRDLDKDSDQSEPEEKSHLTKEEALYMLEMLKDLYPTKEGDLILVSQQAFTDYKKSDSKLLASDFLDIYEKLFQIIHPNRILSSRSLVPMAYGNDCLVLKDDATDFQAVSQNGLAYADLNGEDTHIKEGILAQGYVDFNKSFTEDLFQNQMFLLCDNVILLNLSQYYIVQNRDFSLNSAFIVSNQPNALLVEYKDYRLNLRIGDKKPLTQDKTPYDSFENVTDLYFSEGALAYLKIYTDSISGKLLCITDTDIELEGAGIFPYKKRLPVYKLYGTKEMYHKEDLKIGYDFTDFILNSAGEIVAALVTREENMDRIRVVVKTTSFASAYHENITLTCDQPYFVNEVKYGPGEVFSVSKGDENLAKGRIHIRPETNLAKTTISSIERDGGVPQYRGDFEITETTEGLLLINELLLEEYLYSVVPSEMPASYPMEALKAQAISARTYAYDKMRCSGLQSYGAHVDDSAAFQVYNNIKENENTTLAIRETKDKILTKDGKPAEVYYYSTSCGFGTDIDAWHGSNADQYRYIISRRLSDVPFTGDIKDEETFRNYISVPQADDFEAAEGWYRWIYETPLNIERLNENIKKRFANGKKNIKTMGENGEYTEITPPVFTKIERLEVLKREDGGVADELCISGPEGSIKVLGEHNIRSVLANQCDYVIRGNQSKSAVTTLLPSAFCYIDVTVDESTNAITSYRVFGGGFGHGIGLSQNGARTMANKGMVCSDILQFFFENVAISEL